MQAVQGTLKHRPVVAPPVELHSRIAAALANLEVDAAPTPRRAWLLRPAWGLAAAVVVAVSIALPAAFWTHDKPQRTIATLPVSPPQTLILPDFKQIPSRPVRNQPKSGHNLTASVVPTAKHISLPKAMPKVQLAERLPEKAITKQTLARAKPVHTLPLVAQAPPAPPKISIKREVREARRIDVPTSQVHKTIKRAVEKPRPPVVIAERPAPSPDGPVATASEVPEPTNRVAAVPEPTTVRSNGLSVNEQIRGRLHSLQMTSYEGPKPNLQVSVSHSNGEMDRSGNLALVSSDHVRL